MARRPGPVTRDRRLHGISAYLGKPDALAAEFAAGEVPQRIRTFSQAASDDLVAALDLLGRVKDIAIVVHGPRGCAAALAGSAPHAHWAVTGLDYFYGYVDTMARQSPEDLRRYAATYITGKPRVVSAVLPADAHAAIRLTTADLLAKRIRP